MTTILSVRRGNTVVLGGDGQVSLGNTVMKGNARKVRRLHKDQPASFEFTPLNLEWAKGQMATYKCPREVEFVDRLPRSGTGKIDWRSLQEAARAAAAR